MFDKRYDRSKLPVYRSFHPDKLKFQKYYFPKRSNCIENRIGHKNYKKHHLENLFNFRQFQTRIEKKKNGRIKVLIASRNNLITEKSLALVKRELSLSYKCSSVLITKTYISHRFFFFFWDKLTYLLLRRNKKLKLPSNIARIIKHIDPFSKILSVWIVSALLTGLATTCKIITLHLRATGSRILSRGTKRRTRRLQKHVTVATSTFVTVKVSRPVFTV